jgi:hypothetical protein
VGLLAPFYGRQLRFTQFCQFFSVALGSAVRRDNSNVRYWHLADVQFDTINVGFRGVKRTCRVALQMSAFDPKRTSA